MMDLRTWKYEHVWPIKKRWAQLLSPTEEFFGVAAALALSVQGLLRLPFIKQTQKLESWQLLLFSIGLLSIFATVLMAYLKRRMRARDRKREALFLSNISSLQEELERTILVERATEAEYNTQLDNFVRGLLRLFFETLNVKQGMGVNLMMYDDASKELRITHVHTAGAPVDKKYVATPGVGGAGIAFEKRMPVYIPDVKRGHAILLNLPRQVDKPFKHSVLAKVFVPVSNDVYKVFRSILSVPIAPANENDQEPQGILNFDSPACDPFDEIDFKMAEYFAQLLWMAVSEVDRRAAALK